MHKIERITGTAIPLLLDDIDTDRIIPERYLRCVTFEGLEGHVFEDDREQDPEHPFNNASYKGAKILVAGRNFGCGFPREVAPQALQRVGIDAILGESFADFFVDNCTVLGLPCVTARHEDLNSLGESIRANPKVKVTVDLFNQKVTYLNKSLPVKINGLPASPPHISKGVPAFPLLDKCFFDEGVERENFWNEHTMCMSVWCALFYLVVSLGALITVAACGTNNVAIALKAQPPGPRFLALFVAIVVAAGPPFYFWLEAKAFDRWLNARFPDSELQKSWRETYKLNADGGKALWAAVLAIYAATFYIKQ